MKTIQIYENLLKKLNQKNKVVLRCLVLIFSLLIISNLDCEGQVKMYWDFIYMPKDSLEHAYIVSVVRVCNNGKTKIRFQKEDFYLTTCHSDTIFFDQIMGYNVEPNEDSRLLVQNQFVENLSNEQLKSIVISGEATMHYKGMELQRGNNFSCADINCYWNPR